MTTTSFLGYDMEWVRNYEEIGRNEFDLFKKYYLPWFPLEDKVVLDVGAGCGETAVFYLANGAKHVIAIENSDDAFQALLHNVERNSLSITPIHGEFTLNHMEMPHDFAKFDCERCEAELFNYNGVLKSCFIETHADYITKRLLGQFPLKCVFQYDGGEIWYLQSLESPLEDITPQRFR